MLEIAAIYEEWMLRQEAQEEADAFDLEELAAAPPFWVAIWLAEKQEREGAPDRIEQTTW